MKTIMVVAGEASGDALGAPLLKELKKQNPTLRFIGVGGSAMQAEGLESLFPMEELSVMGLVEVLPKIPHFLKRLNFLVQKAEEEKVDLLLTIDAQDFSKHLSKKIKRKLNTPCVHYVAPTVWAWRAGRAKAMHGVVDHVLALYPFEPPYFEKVNVPCTFVGHPVAERLKAYQPQSKEQATPLQKEDAFSIALFPGSRQGEVTRHWPTMWGTILRLKEDFPKMNVILPVTEKTRAYLPSNLPNWVQVQGAQDSDQKYKALQQCRLALAKSGTGNLELAVLGVPMVVSYKVNHLTACLARFLIDVPYVSPINWILGNKAVSEYLQKSMTIENLYEGSKALLLEKTMRESQVQAFEKVRENLFLVQTPTQLAASIVQSFLK